MRDRRRVHEEEDLTLARAELAQRRRTILGIVDVRLCGLRFGRDSEDRLEQAHVEERDIGAAQRLGALAQDPVRGEVGLLLQREERSATVAGARDDARRRATSGGQLGREHVGRSAAGERLHVEELRHERGVRAAHDDLGTLVGLAYFDDVHLDAGAVLVTLVRQRAPC